MDYKTISWAAMQMRRDFGCKYATSCDDELHDLLSPTITPRDVVDTNPIV